MTLLSNFAGKGRAVVVALVLGATALSSVPAQAQGFGIQIGPGGGGIYVNPGYGGGGYDRDCWSDRRISQYLRAQGYRDIEVRGGGRYVNVRARRDGYYYRIEFDACRGRIVDRERIRRR